MVASQLHHRGIRDRRVLTAFGRVPRHLFVPDHLRSQAYGDHPLPIGSGQTISQPYVVAYMLQALQLTPTDRVLELGAGCGYQTSLLAELAGQVYSMELRAELAGGARDVVNSLGYDRIHIRVGNGMLGWPEKAPFDAIVGSAAAAEVPAALLEQLAPNGRMMLPVGELDQKLMLIVRSPQGYRREELLPVRFVPMLTN